MGSRSRPGEPLLDLRRERQRDARDARQLLGRRLADPLDAPEAPEQRPAAPRPDAGHLVEGRGEPGARPELAVVGVGEAVRLVAHALEQEERARVRLEYHRVLATGEEDALGAAADLARRGIALDPLLGERHDV